MVNMERNKSQFIEQRFTIDLMIVGLKYILYKTSKILGQKWCGFRNTWQNPAHQIPNQQSKISSLDAKYSVPRFCVISGQF